MDQAVQDYHEYVVHDVLGHVKGVTSKKMFGGYGLYLDGVIFAIITGGNIMGGEHLLFKANDETKGKYEELGSQQFVYDGHKTKAPTTMPYWIVPEEIMEDRDRVAEWAHEAAEVSKKGKK